MNDYLVTKELYHHGIKGQKWGIRRFQNEDGTLTEAGLKDLKSLADDPKITEEKFIKKYLENIYETSLFEPEKIATHLDMFEY